jgi:hypothetical protein
MDICHNDSSKHGGIDIQKITNWAFKHWQALFKELQKQSPNKTVRGF